MRGWIEFPVIVAVLPSILGCEAVAESDVSSPSEREAALTLATGAPPSAEETLATEAPPAGDERGMGNTQGYATRLRCALSLAHPAARVYELSHERSGTMPQSPFGAPVEYTHNPSGGLPFTRHAFNGETVTGEVGAQGTQMDALGHFGVIDEVWDPATPFPAESIRYYGGFTQAEVKPTPDSPLLKLGIEKAPPIVTSAVLLDARTYLGNGDRLVDGQLITAADIEGMLLAQGLRNRGLLPGDALYIYTGWEDLWQDPRRARRVLHQGPRAGGGCGVPLGRETDRVDRARHGLHRSGQRGPAPGSSPCPTRCSSGFALLHSPLQPDPGRNSPHRERPSRGARGRWRLDLVHDDLAAPGSRSRGRCRASSRDRRATSMIRR